jgi:hypothetical protein
MEPAIWRKGLVYTKRPPLDSGPYRISASFKCGSGRTADGFGRVYQRVRTLAERVRLESRQTAESRIACHGWRRFGDGDFFAGAFINIEVGGSPGGPPGEPAPTPDDLMTPGGATLEDLTRLSPQSAHEIYNEFDFTDSSQPNVHSITLSYGEPISATHAVDFEPIVQRAERMAESYYAFLKDQDEVRSDVLRITSGESFLANPDFAVVHVFFES